MERGEIKKGTRLIEATSGNTGIALAMIAGIYGLEIELVMPASSTRERTLTMEAFGAKVTLLESIEVCRDYAEEQRDKHGYFYWISLQIQIIIWRIIKLQNGNMA